MFAALFIPHAMRMRHNILSSWFVWLHQIISHYFTNCAILGGKICVLFSLKIFPAIYLILRRIQRHITAVHRSAWKGPTFFLNFNETWFFSTDFPNILKYQYLLKPFHLELRCFMQTDGTVRWLNNIYIGRRDLRHFCTHHLTTRRYVITSYDVDDNR